MTIGGGKVSDGLMGPQAICFGSYSSRGRCVAVFCLIRSSKQALIKKQLLTSPLGHKHRHAAHTQGREGQGNRRAAEMKSHKHISDGCVGD